MKGVKVSRKRRCFDSFSLPHTLAYTLIAIVEANLSHYYNSLYWQTACLTVNSGSLEVDEDAKTKSTNYGKVAEAIGKMKSKGVKVAQPYINKAEFGFVPDIENDQIVFSLKGIVGVGDDVVYTILQNRPYASFEDFIERVYNADTNVKKNHVIKLIKAGAFNEFGKPQDIMKRFLMQEVGAKESLNMQNMKSIIELGLLQGERSIYAELYNFKAYISKSFVRDAEIMKGKRKLKDKILGLDTHATQFYVDNFSGDAVVGNNGLVTEVSDKLLTAEYDEKMKPFKDLLIDKSFIKEYNIALLKKEWMKYAKGTVSKWEMESISYYDSPHELSGMNFEKYNVVNFFELDEEPIIYDYSNFKGKMIPKQKIFTIAGTVLDKNKNRHTITVLTPDGVVTVKTYAGAFAHYDRSVTRRVGDKKEVVEKSWFTRGNLVLLNGYRKGDQFTLKTYRVSGEPVSHTVNLITKVEKNGDVILQEERKRP